jgi:hypothetical protein
VYYTKQSETNFYVDYENNFIILADGKSVVGVEYGGSYNKLVMENLENLGDSLEKPVKFGNGSSYVNLLVVSPDFSSIFVGDNSGKLLQYDFCPSSKSWEFSFNFGDIGIKSLYTCSRYKNLMVFGGYSSNIRVLDTQRKEMFLGPFKTVLSNVLSLRIFKDDKSNILLTVVGNCVNYSSPETDVFKINQLLDFHRIEYDSQHEEDQDINEYDNDEICIIRQTPSQTIDIKEPGSGDFEILINALFKRVETLVVSLLKKNEKKFDQMMSSLSRSKMI